MKVLVVGGAGYVGGALIDVLEPAAGFTLRVYDSLLYEESYRRSVDFTLGDVRDWDRLQPHLDWADAVVWLAAIVGDGACAVEPATSVEINQSCVKKLADSFDGRILFTSTCSVYGANQGILTENSKTNPLSVYAQTKLESEKILAPKNALIFRLGTLFGVGDSFSRLRMDLVVNTLVARAHVHGKIKVFGGEQYRPLLHVRDVAQAIRHGLRDTETGIFNLHRQNVRIIDLAHQVRNHFDDLKIETTEMSFEDARNYQVSSDRAREVLDFTPSHTIDDGILQVKHLVEDQRVDIANPRYSNHGFILQKVEQSR